MTLLPPSARTPFSTAQPATNIIRRRGKEMGGASRPCTPGDFPISRLKRSGAVAGYAYAGPFRTRPAYRFTVGDSICIAPDWQGRGVERPAKESEARGYRQMVAVIGDGAVNIASVRLHAAMGFSHRGRIEGSGFRFGR